MTKFLDLKLSTPLAIAALLAASPVLAMDSDSEDEFTHVPAPLVLGAGIPVIHAQIITAALFDKPEEQEKKGAGAAVVEDQAEDEFAHVPAPLVLGAGMPVIHAQIISADLFGAPEEDDQDKTEE